MSKAMYNSKRLIPAPFLNITKEYQRTPDGTIIGSVFRIAIQGIIIAYMGSPDSSGAFWDQSGYPADESISDSSRLAAIIRKQEAIRELFSQEGYVFEVQSADGSQPLKCNPRCLSVDFEQGLWYDRCNYSIILEADVISVDGQPLGEDAFSEYIIDASENWSFETDETPEGIGFPRTYRLTHAVSATGKRFYDETGTMVKPAWIQARDYVLPRLGFNSFISLSSGVNNLPSYYGGFNHVRNSQQNDLEGTYSVTESWIISSGNAIEQFECNIRSEATNGNTVVSINGSITGLETRDNNMTLLTSKYDNASSKFSTIQPSILTRAQNYAGITLNPVPLASVIGKNEINGVVSYSYDYDNRPSNIFSGMVLENITITEQFPSDLFAVIPVIGRSAGPVLQSLASYTERGVSLNIELASTPPTFGTGSVTELRTAFYDNPRITQPAAFDKIIQAARPANKYGLSHEYIKNQVETFDPKTGRYSFSIDWTFGN